MYRSWTLQSDRIPEVLMMNRETIFWALHALKRLILPLGRNSGGITPHVAGKARRAMNLIPTEAM